MLTSIKNILVPKNLKRKGMYNEGMRKQKT